MSPDHGYGPSFDPDNYSVSKVRVEHRYHPYKSAVFEVKKKEVRSHIWKRGDKVAITDGRHEGRDGHVLRVMSTDIVVCLWDPSGYSKKLTVVKPTDLILIITTVGGKG